MISPFLSASSAAFVSSILGASPFGAPVTSPLQQQQLTEPALLDFTKLSSPHDDSFYDHLRSGRFILPSSALVSSASSTKVDLARLKGLSIVFIHPMIEQPGLPLPSGYADVPGARGCAAEVAAFEQLYSQLTEAGANHIFGLSLQHPMAQLAASQRMKLSFPLLSDQGGVFAKRLLLPSFTVQNVSYLKRATLIINWGKIEHVFYPVFPPDQHAQQVLTWLRNRTEAPEDLAAEQAFGISLPPNIRNPTPPARLPNPKQPTADELEEAEFSASLDRAIHHTDPQVLHRLLSSSAGIRHAFDVAQTPFQREEKAIDDLIAQHLRAANAAAPVDPFSASASASASESARAPASASASKSRVEVRPLPPASSLASPLDELAAALLSVAFDDDESRAITAKVQNDVFGRGEQNAASDPTADSSELAPSSKSSQKKKKKKKGKKTSTRANEQTDSPVLASSSDSPLSVSSSAPVSSSSVEAKSESLSSAAPVMTAPAPVVVLSPSNVPSYSQRVRGNGASATPLPQPRASLNPSTITPPTMPPTASGRTNSAAAPAAAADDVEDFSMVDYEEDKKEAAVVDPDAGFVIVSHKARKARGGKRK